MDLKLILHWCNVTKHSILCFVGREAFIREQMLKRLGKDADEAAASESQLHPEDELYAVPSDLQVCSSFLGKVHLSNGAMCCMHTLLVPSCG